MRRPGICVLAVAFLIGPSIDAIGAAIDRSSAAATAAQCEAAVDTASRELGVPRRLLAALAPAESGISGKGRTRYARPWTLNINGRGSFHFRTRDGAEHHLRKLLAAGVDNVDIGCMQINWHWHDAAFQSPDAALSPSGNVRYAALLLREYRERSGSWAAAVGLYHSRNWELAAAYRCRIARELTPDTEIRDCP